MCKKLSVYADFQNSSFLDRLQSNTIFYMAVPPCLLSQKPLVLRFSFSAVRLISNSSAPDMAAAPQTILIAQPSGSSPKKKAL